MTLCRVDEMVGVSYTTVALPFTLALVGGLLLSELYVPHTEEVASWFTEYPNTIFTLYISLTEFVHDNSSSIYASLFLSIHK